MLMEPPHLSRPDRSGGLEPGQEKVVSLWDRVTERNGWRLALREVYAVRRVAALESPPLDGQEPIDVEGAARGAALRAEEPPVGVLRV